MITLKPLRPHQSTTLAALYEALAMGSRSPIVYAATGFGKTELAAHVIADVREQGLRAAFCVPALTLVDQTFDRLLANGFDPSDIGVMQADHPWRRPHAPIQIATAQTLTRRELPAVDVALIDEAHVLFGVYRGWLSQDRSSPSLCPSSLITLSGGRRAVDFRETGKLWIGLTATPGTKGLGKFYDQIIPSASLAELIVGGFLVPMRVYAPGNPDMSDVETVGDDYHQGQVAEKMDQSYLVADAVQTWLRLGEGRPTLCFATSRRHAQHIHRQYAAAGVSAAYVDADTPREARDELGEAMRAGTVQVAVNIGTLTTGIDWDIRCIQDCCPTKSKMRFVQKIGRGLRTADGKDDLIILDHAGNHLRPGLGMVTDIKFHLCDGKPKPKVKLKDKDADELPLPKCCLSCTALMPAGALRCEACGAEAALPIIHTVDGKLTPFGRHHLPGVLKQIKAAGVALRIREDGKLGAAPAEKITPEVRELIARHRDALLQSLKPKDKRTAKQKLAELGREQVWAMLCTYARSHDLKPGWIAHKFKALFETFPRGLPDDAAAEPIPVLVSWLKAERIKWLHSKAQGGEHAIAS